MKIPRPKLKLISLEEALHRFLQKQRELIKGIKTTASIKPKLYPKLKRAREMSEVDQLGEVRLPGGIIFVPSRYLVEDEDALSAYLLEEVVDTKPDFEDLLDFLFTAPEGRYRLSWFWRKFEDELYGAMREFDFRRKRGKGYPGIEKDGDFWYIRVPRVIETIMVKERIPLVLPDLKNMETKGKTYLSRYPGWAFWHMWRK